MADEVDHPDDVNVDRPDDINADRSDDIGADAVGNGSAAGSREDVGDPEARDAPLGDLARETRERRRRAADGEDPFESVDVGEVDETELWAALAGDGTEDGPSERAVEHAAGNAAARSEHVVDKREYCQRCPFLSSPPAVACGHEGTEIVEAVDPDRFRVRDCPMVTEDGRPDFASAAAGTGTAGSTGATGAADDTAIPTEGSGDATGTTDADVTPDPDT